MNKKCNTCGEIKTLDGFYKRNEGYRSRCRKCSNAAGMKKYYSKKPGYYSIYYLPEENYCGLTSMYLPDRIDHHRKKGRNIDNWRILFCSADKTEAYHTEALFQSTLGMEGLNCNTNYKK